MSNFEEEFSDRMLSIISNIAKWQEAGGSPSAASIVQSIGALKLRSFYYASAKKTMISSSLFSVADAASTIDSLKGKYLIDQEILAAELYLEKRGLALTEISNIVFDSDNEAAAALKIILTQYIMLICEFESGMELYELDAHDAALLDSKTAVDGVENEELLDMLEEVLKYFKFMVNSVKAHARYKSILSKSSSRTQFKANRVKAEKMIKEIICYGLDN